MNTAQNRTAGRTLVAMRTAIVLALTTLVVAFGGTAQAAKTPPASTAAASGMHASCRVVAATSTTESKTVTGVTSGRTLTLRLRRTVTDTTWRCYGRKIVVERTYSAWRLVKF